MALFIFAVHLSQDVTVQVPPESMQNRAWAFCSRASPCCTGLLSVLLLLLLLLQSEALSNTKSTIDPAWAPLSDSLTWWRHGCGGGLRNISLQGLSIVAAVPLRDAIKVSIVSRRHHSCAWLFPPLIGPPGGLVRRSSFWRSPRRLVTGTAQPRSHHRAHCGPTLWASPCLAFGLGSYC